jgi:hypothetical protein
MAIPTIKNYAEVQELLNAFVKAAGVTPGLAPHKVFWNHLTYEEFITGNVPGVTNPNFKILEVGNSAKSNIIMALSGTAGSPFDPNGTIGQMPQYNPPYNSGNPTQNEVIAALKAWIDGGCKNIQPTAVVTVKKQTKKKK